MSSSRLKPSVTPVTAFAARLRDRPWNFLNCASSDSRLATIVLGFDLHGYFAPVFPAFFFKTSPV